MSLFIVILNGFMSIRVKLSKKNTEAFKKNAYYDYLDGVNYPPPLEAPP